MTWIDAQKEANKIVKILSDNRIMPSEWKYAIPMFIAQSPITVVINAKNLADGINEAIEKYHPDFPQDKIAYNEFSEDFMID
jgi:hypothetical protein